MAGKELIKRLTQSSLAGAGTELGKSICEGKDDLKMYTKKQIRKIWNII